MSRNGIVALILVLAVAAAGIGLYLARSGSETPPPPATPTLVAGTDRPSVIRFDANEKMVPVKDMRVEEADQAVKGDFNRDGLEDVAVLHKKEGKGSEVTVYVQKVARFEPVVPITPETQAPEPPQGVAPPPNPPTKPIEPIETIESTAPGAARPAGQVEVIGAAPVDETEVKRIAIPEAPPIYYESGRIVYTDDGDIIGLGTRTRKTYIDLVLVVQPTDGAARNRIVQYKNEGDRFVEVAGPANAEM